MSSLEKHRGQSHNKNNVTRSLENVGFSYADAELVAKAFATITLNIQGRLQSLSSHFKGSAKESFNDNIPVFKEQILYHCLEILIKKGSLPQNDEIPVEVVVEEWRQRMRSVLLKLIGEFTCF